MTGLHPFERASFAAATLTGVTAEWLAATGLRLIGAWWDAWCWLRRRDR
jgi:hypothetical protein